MEKEEIETWIKNAKTALPFLEEKVGLLKMLLPTDEQIEKNYEQRNMISNMLKPLREIKEQVEN